MFDDPTRSHRLLMRHWHTLGALATAAALAGCGGGSDSADAEAQVEDPAAPASAPATAGGRATCNLAGFEAAMLATVNAHRAAGASCGTEGSFAAAPALTWNTLLTQASLAHSDDMVARTYFSHTGSDGSSAAQRATAAGYAWQMLGENIAAGQPSVAAVVAGWMASPGHCANIMAASFRDIGVACVNGGSTNTYRTYWTMTLGLAR